VANVFGNFQKNKNKNSFDHVSWDLKKKKSSK